MHFQGSLSGTPQGGTEDSVQVGRSCRYRLAEVTRRRCNAPPLRRKIKTRGNGSPAGSDGKPYYSLDKRGRQIIDRFVVGRNSAFHRIHIRAIPVGGVDVRIRRSSGASAGCHQMAIAGVSGRAMLPVWVVSMLAIRHRAVEFSRTLGAREKCCPWVRSMVICLTKGVLSANVYEAEDGSFADNGLRPSGADSRSCTWHREVADTVIDIS